MLPEPGSSEALIGGPAFVRKAEARRRRAGPQPAGRPNPHPPAYSEQCAAACFEGLRRSLDPRS